LCRATFDHVTGPNWPAVPAAPGSLSATAGNAQVTLDWTAASGASSYNVKSATNSGGPYAVIANVATTNYTDTGLLNGVSYFYVVSALNLAGESADCAPVGATPQAPPGLVIFQTGTNLLFCWPAASVGWGLQSCTNLAAGNWVNMTSPAAQIISNQWWVNAPLPDYAPGVFYRLAH